MSTSEILRMKLNAVLQLDEDLEVRKTRPNTLGYKFFSLGLRKFTLFEACSIAGLVSFFNGIESERL